MVAAPLRSLDPGAARYPRSVLVALLAIAFFAIPFAELAIIITVGQELGIPETLVLLVGISVVGAWLAKRQGLAALRAVQRRLDSGEMPGRELIDGLLILVGAVLLLTPGFLTDAIALLLLLPPVRALLRGVVRRRFERRIEVRTYRTVRTRLDRPDRPDVIDVPPEPGHE